MTSPRPSVVVQRRDPPSAWYITRAAVRILCALPAEDLNAILADPLAPTSEQLFRRQLHDLDARFGARRAWIEATHREFLTRLADTTTDPEDAR